MIEAWIPDWSSERLLGLLDTERPTWRMRLADGREWLARRRQHIARSATYTMRSALRTLRGRPPVPEGPPRAPTTVT